MWGNSHVRFLGGWESAMTPGYPTTGTVVVVSLLLAAVLFAGLGRMTGLTPLAVIGPALMAVFLALFYALTVEIDATHLRFRFGIGLIRKRIPLAEIVEAKPVRNSWLYGWGIHRTPHGWLYNVSGWERGNGSGWAPTNPGGWRKSC